MVVAIADIYRIEGNICRRHYEWESDWCKGWRTICNLSHRPTRKGVTSRASIWFWSIRSVCNDVVCKIFSSRNSTSEMIHSLENILLTIDIGCDRNCLRFFLTFCFSNCNRAVVCCIATSSICTYINRFGYLSLVRI